MATVPGGPTEPPCGTGNGPDVPRRRARRGDRPRLRTGSGCARAAQFLDVGRRVAWMSGTRSAAATRSSALRWRRHRLLTRSGRAHECTKRAEKFCSAPCPRRFPSEHGRSCRPEPGEGPRLLRLGPSPASQPGSFRLSSLGAVGPAGSPVTASKGSPRDVGCYPGGVVQAPDAAVEAHAVLIVRRLAMDEPSSPRDCGRSGVSWRDPDNRLRPAFTRRVPARQQDPNTEPRRQESISAAGGEHGVGAVRCCHSIVPLPPPHSQQLGCA
ncbi:hypothetical protein GA0115252_10811 [Streptomyces sp. DfronAA-171]|nr:hypothetical protein GA0115252_10811 [Streptomyces sp. DfronAA-171]